ncbi:MAG: phage scaffolding protein [Monoglobales bacterium]
MDFLKEALGENFEEFKEKIEKYNRESDSQLKLANLSEGGYVSREKYEALCGQIEKLKEESAKPFIEEIEQLKSKMTEAENKHAIDLLIKSSGAKNLTAVRALLNLENADVEDVQKQLEIIRSENEYLFDKPQASGATGMRQGSARKESSAEEELRQKIFGK